MPERMVFGKYKKQNKSVEQVALADYGWFAWLVDNVDIGKRSLSKRVKIVEYVLNNFVPQLPCGYEKCQGDGTPRWISIYHGYREIRTSSTDFIYCSDECFRRDPKVTVESHKPRLSPLEFRTAVSSTKSDTNQLVKVMCDCMGMRKGRRTKEYLENFINEMECFEGDDPRERYLF